MTFFKQKPSWQPKPYQEAGIELILTQAPAGLILDPGMGKTSTVLAAFTILKEQQAVNKMLIIAPLRVCYSVWPTEAAKWAEFEDIDIGILHGPKKNEVLHEEHDIYVINPEGLKWFADNDGFNVLSADMLCVDESTRFKNTGSGRFKILRPWVPAFKRRVILTGTFAPNGLMDLFGQVFILDNGGALGRYITHYRNKWFIQSGFGGYEWTPKHNAMEEITERIAPMTMRLKASDHLDLPELRVGGQWDIHVDLPPKAMAQYKEVEGDFLSKMEGGDIVAANAAAAGTKCRQIANGAVFYTTYDDDGIPDVNRKEWVHVHDAKLDALESIVEELGQSPLLVFYEYQHDLERIQKKLKCPTLSGTSPRAADLLIQQFNRGEIPVLLAHPASAGHGLNMQEACHHVCFFGLTWDLELYDQALKRVYRQGQGFPVTVYRILARGTLDETVAERLLEKDAVQNDIYDLLSSLAL